MSTRTAHESTPRPTPAGDGPGDRTPDTAGARSAMPGTAGARSATPGTHAGRPAVYAALALGLSWLVWVPGLLAAPGSMLVLVAGAFGPALAGALMIRLGGGRVRDWLRGMAVFRVPLRWYALALALPLVQPVVGNVVLGGAGVPLAFDELVARLPTFLGSFAFMLLLGGGQEELGWRGYFLPALQDRLTPVTASLLLGGVWAVWHLPLFVLPLDGAPAPSFFAYVPVVLAMAVAFTWVFNRTRGSVVVAMLMHASFNAGTTFVLVSDPAHIDRSIELAISGAFAVVFVLGAAVLVKATGGRLGAQAEVAQQAPGETSPQALAARR